MSNRKDLIRMKWREDDTIRFYRDTPDKRGVSEMVINNKGGGGLHRHFGQRGKRIDRIMSTYKRGTVLINGKQYGRYPDGSLYRIYSTNEHPFMQMVDVEGETFLRVRQATEQGYTDCPVWGCVDLAYPTSQLRRARTISGGRLVNALTCGQQLAVLVEV